MMHAEKLHAPFRHCKDDLFVADVGLSYARLDRSHVRAVAETPQ